MSILHLSTHDTRGGAACSALRLLQGQLASGLSSRMLVRTKHSEQHEILASDDGSLAAWHEHIATPWLQSQLPPGAPWFTSGSMDADIATHPWVQEADILHLHWVAEWLTARDIAALAALGKPIYWTFHDLWPLSCGLHYTGSNTPENDHWQTGADLPDSLRPLAQREFQRKLDLLAPLPIHVIAPSRWIGQQCRRSHIGQRWSVDVIPYGIDTDIFHPQDRQAARAALNLPPNMLLLLFGAAALSEPRKGLLQLQEALTTAELDPHATELIVFGQDTPDLATLPTPVLQLGPIDDAATLAKIYAAADAYLCPTLEDNLPNTVLEALCCGTPVIGFATGGIPDVVVDQKNGLLAPTGDSEALGQRLAAIATQPSLLQALQNQAQEIDLNQFTLRRQAEAVQRLYFTRTSAAPRNAISLPATASQETDWFPEAAAHSLAKSAAHAQESGRKLQNLQSKLAKNSASQP